MWAWHTNFVLRFPSVILVESTPSDLFSFMLLILLATSGVTLNCPNIYLLGPLDFATGVGNELMSTLVNNELKGLGTYLIPLPLKIVQLLYSQHHPSVFPPYLKQYDVYMICSCTTIQSFLYRQHISPALN